MRLLIFTTALMCCACSVQETNDVAAVSAGITSPSLQDLPAAYKSVTAQQLVQAYLKNPGEANGKYQGQPLEVTGVFTEADTDMWGKPYILLYSKDIVSRVQCFLTEKSALTRLKPPASITVRGYCDGFGRHVLLRDAVLMP